MQESRFLISGIESIRLNYNVSEHFVDCKDIGEMRQADLNALDNELREAGSSLEEKISKKIIWRMKFPNMVLDAKELSVDYRNNSATINAAPIHPHRADLAFKKDASLLYNSLPITISAIQETIDDLVVLAVRGGSVAGGKIGIIPGGHAEYRQDKTDLFSHLAAEYEEEVGFVPDREKIKLIGLFCNRDTNGLNALYVARTGKSFNEIEEAWRNASDAWEHASLLDLTKSQVKELGETGKICYQSKAYETTPFFQDCLVNYLHSKL